MVLLAAAICTKQGKALVSRQFVEMSRPRIEGLLSSFPKLMGSGKQHTFVETDSVRYVYQSLDKLYILIITTKESNILEDLETLRLFSRVVPEYCSNYDEEDILEHCFELIAAMDEMVALGYRESINLSQIRQYTEMVSHDEQVYLSMRKTQEKQAKERMREKAKEIKQARKEAMKGGHYPSGGISGGFGGGMSSGQYGGHSDSTASTAAYTKPSEPSYSKSSRPSASKAMKLGKKGKDVDTFVDKLINEGERVSSMAAGKQPSQGPSKTGLASSQNSVHFKVSEKIGVSCGSECSMDVSGVLLLLCADAERAHLKVEVEKDDESGFQYNTHPNINKALFAEQSVIAMKSEGKAFPIKSEVPLLKYRLHSTNEDHLPIKISCWPSQVGEGFEVTVEYELQQEHMALSDVVVSIPMPSGVGTPVVGDCEGNYSHDSRKHILYWTIPHIDSSSANGSMEFTVPGSSDDFMPIRVEFVSETPFCCIKPVRVLSVSDDEEIKYSSELLSTPENYEFK